MAHLEFSRDFSVAPNEVFVFFVPLRMPLWYGTEMDSHFEVQGGASDFAVGQKVQITGKLGKREVSLTVVITAYRWEKLLEWQFQDSYGVRGLQRWELESLPSGTRLHMRDSYKMPGLSGRLIDAAFTRFAVAQRDRTWLDRLERLAERK
ncbi:MAG TPA: SRPBCC family protein [Candidatus Acidoferrales bacterium]|nr:SRPBCC family protein [Candidatus Acidoferrales bacterium]